MRKQLKIFAGLFLFVLFASCAADQLEINETSTENSETVWNYDGDSTTLQKVIDELKNSENRKPLERRLSKNEVLWKEAKFLLIDNKKRIMVPFLSVDRENVIGVLALVKDAKGKTTFDMAVRSRLTTKDNKLPFWNPDIWMGYFMALDKDILGIKNGNPGFKQAIANNKKSKTNARIQCDLYETITSHCSYAYIISATGEAYGFIDRGCTDTYSYTQECYWVPDPIIPIIEPTTNIGTDGSGGGGGGAPITILSPDTPINNIQDFLKCFNSSLGAQLTIYIDQPVANSDTPYTTGNGKAGHSFIGITQGNVTRFWGLYPEGNANPFSPNDPHKFGNNQNQGFDVSITYSINSYNLSNVINDAITYNINYDLNSNNCTDYAIQVAMLTGVILPDPQSTWTNGGGSNPGAFGQAIRNMVLPQGVTRNTNGGTSNSNSGNCN